MVLMWLGIRGDCFDFWNCVRVRTCGTVDRIEVGVVLGECAGRETPCR